MTKRLEIRLGKEDFDIISQKAKFIGLKPSQYLRMILFKHLNKE